MLARTVCRLLALSACAAAPLSAQAIADRGALIIRRGTDTVVVDRFIRTTDHLTGSVQVTGQPRIDYIAALGADETVRALTLGVYPLGSPSGAAPLQRVRITMRGDSALVETAAGTQRIGTRADAIPMFNNALALSELFTRRARLSGGIADVPFLVLSGGTTVNVAIRPASLDSLTFTVPGQVQRFRVDPVGRILGGDIAGTNMTFERLASSAADGLDINLRDSTVAPVQDYTAPAGAPYTAEEVHLRGPAGILGGTLTKPIGARAPMPAVVTITGSGQQDRDEYIPVAGGVRLFRQVADTLSRRGIAVLRLDDRGLGASGGSAATSTTADFADDIRAAIAYLRARKDIDPDRIALVGHSEGGVIAPMIAATDPRLKAIVVMAGPGESGIELSMAQNAYIVDHDMTLTSAQRDSILRAARASLDPARQTLPWVKFWMGYDPATVAPRVKAATLILQGATDRQVPMQQAEKLAALIRSGGNKDVTVHVFPTTNHLFIEDAEGDFNKYDKLRTNRVGANVMGVLADWLVAKLARAP